MNPHSDLVVTKAPSDSEEEGTVITETRQSEQKYPNQLFVSDGNFGEQDRSEVNVEGIFIVYI